MQGIIEGEEQARLRFVLQRLQRAVQDLDGRLSRYAREIQQEKTYLWESRADMDHVEKVFTRQTIEQSVMTGDAALAHRKRLARLVSRPYFARVDFARDGGDRADPIYIGIHHFDDGDETAVIHDWRAPVSTMFYDYETGPAAYASPSGDVSGMITLKRQFQIRNGEIELMLDSAVNVVDDVLQRELSRSSDDGMKQIVATIQRDQNAIIRNADAAALVIQGVAGSGKTSIALHRIAFLLYRFKDTLQSKDILIISPNAVFSDYISNVLPELGEESVDQIGMEFLAREILGPKVRFQTAVEQSVQLQSSDDEQLHRRIAFKASVAFLRQLDEYADEVERATFAAEDTWIGRSLVPAWFIEERFRRHRGIPPASRFNAVARDVEHGIGVHYNHNLDTTERADLRAAIRRMYRGSTVRAAYKNFYAWAGVAELHKVQRATLEHADVFPLIYLKLRLEGADTDFSRVKHLLVDEMQDYTPVQYAVIAHLFRCNKTILGDVNQGLNPYGGSSMLQIQQVLPAAVCVTLNTSYRSTFEITQFAQRISPNPNLVAIERHGESPEIVDCKDAAEEMSRICEWIDGFAESAHTTAGIVCKTEDAARRLHAAVAATGRAAVLMSADSKTFAPGLIVCSAYVAKGLEFDRVMVPGATAVNYRTPVDRRLLYVACTRAMHRLTLTVVGPVTTFVVE